MTEKYSVCWFNPHIFEILNKFKGKDNINFIEIGSFEGYSTNYFIDNYLTGANCYITCIDPWIKYSEATTAKINGFDHQINENVYNIFLNNISKNKAKVIIKRGFSKNILPELDQKYDFIYVDGDHSEESVWLDATLGFDILKIGGFMIFDDYTWGTGKGSPKKAIDNFLVVYQDCIKVIFIAYQVCIEKIKNFNQ